MYNPRFDKQTFKREVTENVKTLFRKTIEEATPQQLYQAVSYVVKGSNHRRLDHLQTYDKKMSPRWFTICLWSS